MLDAGELRKGVTIELNGELYQILDYQHQKIGRGSAVVRLKLRDIRGGHTIERTFQGAVVLKSGGPGIETISFVPDPNHPEGGTFYVANQGFDLEDKEDPSAIFEIEVPLKSGSAGKLTAKIVRFFSIGVIDLAGSHYDKASDLVYIISDATNTFFEITRTGKVLRAYAFPGDNQEGIAVDDEGFVYIAQDSGGIIKVIRNNRKR